MATTAAYLLGLGGVDLGVGVGEREDDRAGRPCRRSTRASRTPGAQTPMNTSAPRSASAGRPDAGAGWSPRRARRGPSDSASSPAAERPSRSHDDDVAHAGREQQRDDRRAGGAAAGDDDLTSASSFSTQRSALVSAASTTIAVPCWSSWKTGMSSDSRSRRLDLEAARRGDVLEVDAAEAGRDHLDRADDLVGVLAGQADRPGVDVGEPLEQRGLALHHRHRGAGADVAEAEHRRAVGDDGDRVALDGEPADVLGVLRRSPSQTRPTPGV